MWTRRGKKCIHIHDDSKHTPYTEISKETEVCGRMAKKCVKLRHAWLVRGYSKHVATKATLSLENCLSNKTKKNIDTFLDCISITIICAYLNVIQTLNTTASLNEYEAVCWFRYPIPSIVLGAYRSLHPVGFFILLLNDCSKTKRWQSTSFCLCENQREFLQFSDGRSLKRGNTFPFFHARPNVLH